MRSEFSWLAVAALTLACGRVERQPATAASEATSDPSETAASGDGGITYEGGDGLSCKTAIAIVGAHGESDGVTSEYAWINRHYPGSKFKQQSLVECGGAAADQMEIVSAEGEEVVLFFDISRFFGKL